MSDASMSASRPKRKRNLEAEADHVDCVEKTLRPRRRRRGGENGSANGNANANGQYHDVHDDLEIEKGRLGNGHGASSSLNELSGARASSTNTALQQPWSSRQSLAAGSSPSRSKSADRKIPSGLQHMRRLAEDSMQGNYDPQSESWDRKGEDHSTNNEIGTGKSNDADNTPLLCERYSHSVVETDDANVMFFASALDRERRKLKAFLLFSIVSIIYSIATMFVLSSIIYTQDFNHNLAILQRDASNANNARAHDEKIERAMQMHEGTRLVLQTVRGHLEDSQETVAQLQQVLSDNTKTHQMEINQYRDAFQQHDKELSDAVDRIKTLRDGKEESNSAIDMAWLRMDELMEENNELYNDLKEARKHTDDIARVQMRDKELIQTVESLSHELNLAISEKDDLREAYEHSLAHSKEVVAQSSLLQQNHVDISDTFLGPILVYIQKVIKSTEQQHSIILDLTSLVHSLKSSLEMSRADLEAQATEGMHAVDAVAKSTSELAHLKTQAYEMERTYYMEHMEMQLQNLEDEAMGAVSAVAEAAGKLEYERKLEEEGRWRSYVAEVEGILGGVRENMEDGSTGDNFAKGVTETSVLRAAISRRIEDGFTSLRSYIHPYNYFKERDGALAWSGQSQSN